MTDSSTSDEEVERLLIPAEDRSQPKQRQKQVHSDGRNF
jgi:hypothetical protein